MQDMLRLTQQSVGVATTRHSKKPGGAGSLLTGAVGVGSPQNALNTTSDDFLKKIKM